MQKIILTDVDGVLVDWVSAFERWMLKHGYKPNPDKEHEYQLSSRYGITSERASELVAFFNESAYIEYVPPMDDAIYYVDLLHRKHGYVFHAITSLSLDPRAIELRRRNLHNLFGPTAFERIVCLDVGAHKYEALKPYDGTELFWIEDKIQNAVEGLQFGLKCIIYDQPYNRTNHQGVIRCNDWSEVYQTITG